LPVKRTAVPVCLLLALLLTAPRAHAAAARDSVARDSLVADSARVVRTLPPTIVRASPLDFLSTEARRSIAGDALRTLPLDRAADALALEPGVVVEDDVVHVRGARPGELRVEMDGIGLNEPLRGEAPDLPLVALDDLELVRGGREAERGAGLAGTLSARPLTAGDRWHSRLLWTTDVAGNANDDRVGGRVSGPLPGTGLGLGVAGEMHLEDDGVPDLRTSQFVSVLGGSLRFRGQNRLAALARLAPVKEPRRFAIEAMVTRKLLRPFDPMFERVGWTSPCPDPDCEQPPAYSPTEIDGGQFARYVAPDHFPVTDVRRTTLIASSEVTHGADRLRAALGWNHERRITSLSGGDDEAYLAASHAPVFGAGVGASDPFHIYLGDTPYFRKSIAEWVEGRVDWHRAWPTGSAVGAGLGATHDHVDFHEVDTGYRLVGYDSVRVFVASAPGASGWASGRWVSEGLIGTFGMRADWFTPGADADRTLHDSAPHGTVLLSPRLGLSFPLSATDAFQVSYERLAQAPGREFLYDSRTREISPRRPLGNPLLDPSIAISYEALVRHHTGALWTSQAGFFWRDLSGEVGARHTVLANGEDALGYESADYGHALGLEVSLERDDPGKSHFAATYTWMRTEGSESFEDGVPYYPLQLPQPPPISEHPLSWDEPQHLTLQAFWSYHVWRIGWSTVIASGRPWTPAAIREPAADLSLTNTRRLPPYTRSDVTLTARLPDRLAPLRVGLDVRNVFDFRAEKRVSIDGYPNPVINTAFDDYAAHREATGGGPAYWDDGSGWVGVHDPRVDFTPRVVRLVLEVEW